MEWCKHLLSAVCLAAVAGVTAAVAAAPDLRLENDHYLVEVRPPDGVITRIRDQERGLELLQEPRLAVAQSIMQRVQPSLAAKLMYR